MATQTAFSEPWLWDKISQELNTSLATLNYFDDQYMVAHVGFDGDETFPEIYKNDGSRENFRILPDSTRAMSFFIMTGDTDENDEYHMTCPMALCVWMNLELVVAAKNYDYTSEIVRDCFNKLRDYGCYDLSVDINSPFDGFSELAKGVKANLMRPYSGFKISFLKSIEVCQP